jgi:hypothetical protein
MLHDFWKNAFNLKKDFGMANGLYMVRVNEKTVLAETEN